MNARFQPWFEAVGRLFRYPTDEYAAEARRLAESLRAADSRAAASMALLADYAQSAAPQELEEAFTRTFDLNPACAPEIGWHLFGEEYLRGLFMVRIRAEMRARGLEETGELPDHVVHLLAVLAAMEPGPARELARACVLPAVGKMQRALAEGDSPFRFLVDAAAELLLDAFDLSRDALRAREEDAPIAASCEDPLRGPACGGCAGGQRVLFSLESAATRPADAPAKAPQESLP